MLGTCWPRRLHRDLRLGHTIQGSHPNLDLVSTSEVITALSRNKNRQVSQKYCKEWLHNTSFSVELDRTHPSMVPAHEMVAGEFREGKMRADDSAPPPRGKGVDVSLTLVRTRALRTLRLDHLLLRSCLPLFYPRLHLALPAGKGGARAATLAFCAYLCPQMEMGQDPCIVRAQTWTFIRWQALTLIQVFQQISLVCLKHRHRVQRSNSLTCCCVFLKGLSGVFVCMLQTRVTLTKFPIATPRGRSSKFPRKGTSYFYNLTVITVNMWTFSFSYFFFG